MSHKRKGGLEPDHCDRIGCQPGMVRSWKERGSYPIWVKSKAIPIGKGLLEQMSNETTYTKLTYNDLKDIINGMGKD